MLQGDRAFSTKLQLSTFLLWVEDFLSLMQKNMKSKACSSFAYWFSEIITNNHMFAGYKCCVVYTAFPQGAHCPEDHK